MCIQSIKNTTLAEITASSISAGQRYNFPDIEYLRGAFITGLICHCLEVDYSVSTGGYAIVSQAALRQATVTLYVDGATPVLQFPAYQLIPGNNGGFIRAIAGLKVNLPKSFVQINGTSGYTANDTFAFSFIY